MVGLKEMAEWKRLKMMRAASYSVFRISSATADAWKRQTMSFSASPIHLLLAYLPASSQQIP